MDDKYVTFTLAELKGMVNELAIDMMLPIDTANVDDDTDKRNIFAAIYNDGIRCFAGSLAMTLYETAKEQE
jgi:hypothetical protein